ncbi:MAG TPA: MotA/TolQ/ExbB proton channel family protein [Fibrobacteria bacterium]|nr:MotA/TolQ/ExbB proton channel family protein [Fibrobacteria bacterium]
MVPSQGLTHFLDRMDPVGWATFASLMLLSVASWSAGIAKLCQILSLLGTERRTRRLEAEDSIPADSPWRRIHDAGLRAAHDLSCAAPDALVALSRSEFLVAEAFGDALNQERERLESGLGLIATASSTAPFVGLFGTVWSIHRALVAIGASGEAGLDKVAGPVGEALVMTGIGLAVAIPALVSYNLLVSLQRELLGRMERIARTSFFRLATLPPSASPRTRAGIPSREGT